MAKRSRRHPANNKRPITLTHGQFHTLQAIVGEVITNTIHDQGTAVRLLGELRVLSTQVLGYDTLRGESDPQFQE